MSSPCCVPNAVRAPLDAATFEPPASGGRVVGEMASIPEGTFLMGSDDEISYQGDGEGPVHEVSLSPFLIDVHAVTNTQFATFVEDTGYLTDSERFGWSFVFAGLLPDEFPPTRGASDAPWWRQVEGADWRHPEGLGSVIDDRASHPVVHVSWADASGYAAWAGKQLPSEPQWEYAARGGLQGARFPWGDELAPGGEQLCNTWQGLFPTKNTEEDGWYGTSPADAFPANGFGLYNMIGNVWEWCADWFDTTSRDKISRVDPQGPPDGELRVLKGGSFLCHASYCARYRPAARIGSTPDSGASNVGFRCSRPG